MPRPKKAFAFSNTRPEGARIVRLAPGGRVQVLTPEFASACDPALSFDAKRMLFAAKRTVRDPWSIWEMSVDGSAKREITRGFGNCGEPRYLALGSITPPDFDDKVRWIAFSSDAAGTYEELTNRLSTSLYVRNIEPIAGRGVVTWRTSFNLSSDFSPTVLRDGRVLFTSRQPGGDPAHPYGRFPLLLTNWDGTGLNLFYGNSDGATLNTMGVEMPDRTLVFVESDGEDANGAGRLARVSFKRPLHSHEVISRQPGLYSSPAARADGTLVVSYAAEKASFGIFRFGPDLGSPAEALVDDPKWDDMQPVPVEVRAEPTGLLSAVVESAETADLQCLNVYESDTPEPPRKGEVKSVRLIEGVPLPAHEKVLPPLPGSSSFSNVRTRILGEAPVEEDGSFLVTLPADTPFFVQLLDAGGMAIKNMRGWMWVRKGTSRGCLGCHENKEMAPENRATLALIKHRPAELLAPPAQRRSLDFQKDIMPLLQERCASCHGGKSPMGGFKVADSAPGPFNSAYRQLLAGAPAHTAPGGRRTSYVVPGSARESALSQIIGAVKPSRSGAAGHPGVELRDEERRAIVQWIDLGARWAN